MKNIKLTAEEMVIVDRLKQMKMSGMVEAYENRYGILIQIFPASMRDFQTS